jgi:hypothetical protein
VLEVERAAGAGDGRFDVAGRRVDPSELWLGRAAGAAAGLDDAVREARLGEAQKATETVGDDLGAGGEPGLGIALDLLLGEAGDPSQLDLRGLPSRVETAATKGILFWRPRPFRPPSLTRFSPAAAARGAAVERRSPAARSSRPPRRRREPPRRWTTPGTGWRSSARPSSSPWRRRRRRPPRGPTRTGLAAR